MVEAYRVTPYCDGLAATSNAIADPIPLIKRRPYRARDRMVRDSALVGGAGGFSDVTQQPTDTHRPKADEVQHRPGFISEGFA